MILQTQRKSQKALANPKEELRAAWRAFVRKCLREPGVWIEKTRQGNLFQVKVNNKMRRREDKIFHNLPLDQF
ncbi:hypothetical protein B9Z55_027367 [Caenorhabditis nigoni]|uniref:Uncharacterized protein n=1 Tax=Caenorhabditis nigoni TaxID=1611254 RepID=A0A2G5SG62_9PELO|nr:hypothetical protein B9Z55_027367 [Caenorhabditis nigoni]